MPDVYTAKITSCSPLAANIFSLTFECADIAGTAKAGQFVHIKCGTSLLLRRPLSICSTRAGCVRIVFEVKGEGTRWLSRRCPGDILDVLGPLGHGFDFPGGSIIAAGGGIGVPPMLFAAESAKGGAAAVLGFRSKDAVILREEFENICSEVVITTDDGSSGRSGTVAQPLDEMLASGHYDAVMACGPRAMLKAVAALCARHDTPCRVSLEERMGCGTGACLVCACETNGGMARVCADGPVFDAQKVKW